MSSAKRDERLEDLPNIERVHWKTFEDLREEFVGTSKTTKKPNEDIDSTPNSTMKWIESRRKECRVQTRRDRDSWWVDRVSSTRDWDWIWIVFQLFVTGRLIRNWSKYSRRFAWRFNSFLNSSKAETFNDVEEMFDVTDREFSGEMEIVAGGTPSSNKNTESRKSIEEDRRRTLDGRSEIVVIESIQLFGKRRKNLSNMILIGNR